jgi:hypothetical protein
VLRKTFLALLTASLVAAQFAGAPQPLPVVVLPAGARFTARMTQSIATVPALGPDRRAELTRSGQRFHALLVTPIVDAANRVRMPAGTLVEGRIVTLSPGQGVRPPRVDLTVERLCNRPLRARVVDPPVDRIERQRTRQSFAGATFAWLFMGTICFGMPGFMLGSTVGSASGVVAETRSLVIEAWLSAGTIITVEVSEPAALGPACRV